MSKRLPSLVLATRPLEFIATIIHSHMIPNALVLNPRSLRFAAATLIATAGVAYAQNTTPVAAAQNISLLPGAATPVTLSGSDANGDDLNPPLYSAHIAGSSPVAYWRLGETSFTTAAAAAGSLAGTYYGTPATEAGALTPRETNAGVRFNGDPTRVEFADDGTLDMASAAVTLSAWIKLDQLPSAQANASASIFDSNSEAFSFTLNKAAAALRFKVTDADGTVATADIPQAQLATGQWFHSPESMTVPPSRCGFTRTAPSSLPPPSMLR